MKNWCVVSVLHVDQIFLYDRIAYLSKIIGQSFVGMDKIVLHCIKYNCTNTKCECVRRTDMGRDGGCRGEFHGIT